MNTALAAALDGRPVAPSQAPRALAEAAEKLSKLKDTLSTAKAHAHEGASAALYSAETLGTVAVGSAVEGYFGEEKMMPGKIPVRGAAGLLLGGWGIARTVMGRDGGHQLAFGTGLMALDVAVAGRAAGRALREKWAKGSPAPANTVPSAAQQQLLQANPGAQLVNGRVVSAQGATLDGDDLGNIARLIANQPGTAGDARAPRRALPAGAVRRA